MAIQQKLRVLVIDDEVTQRMLVKEYLEEAGHSVRLSEDGKRGLKMATAITPDIILLDLMLPSIDGYSLCRSIKSNPVTAEVPVILITASREADVIEKGLAAGADDFLTKPVDWAFLSDRVLNVVSKAKERAEMARLIRAQSEVAAQPQVSLVQKAEIEAQIDELMRTAEQQLARVQEESRAERARLEAQHAEAVNLAIEKLSEEYQAEFDAEIAAREAAHRKAMAEAVAFAAMHARDEVRAELSARDIQASSAVTCAIEEARAQFNAEIAALKAAHVSALKSQRERFELDIETIRNSAQHEQLVIERRHANEMIALRSALEAANSRADAIANAAGAAAVQAPGIDAASLGQKVQAAWSLALRSATAQSILASAVAAKTSAAVTAGPGSSEHADLDRTVRSLNNLLASFKLLSQAMVFPEGTTEGPVDLRRVASDIAAQASRIARDRNVEVRASLSDGVPDLMADESRLRYAWMCLVLNAIRFTPAGGTVDLTFANGAGGAICIGVSDNGVGIAPNKLAELLTCLDVSSPGMATRPGDGAAGLGVPVATALARQMGGSLEFDSKLGGGTRAMLVFPAAKRIGQGFNQKVPFIQSA